MKGLSAELSAVKERARALQKEQGALDAGDVSQVQESKAWNLGVFTVLQDLTRVLACSNGEWETLTDVSEVRPQGLAWAKATRLRMRITLGRGRSAWRDIGCGDGVHC